MTTLDLDDDEARLILAMRERQREIDALWARDDAERQAWKLDHPGQHYSALSVEGSAGGDAYNKIVESMAEAALDAFKLVASRLGATVFQASLAELEFLRRSRNIEGAFGIYQVSHALHPQNGDVPGRISEFFDSDDVVEWLGNEAEARLMMNHSFVAPEVIAHWRKLVAARDKRRGESA